MGKLNFIKGKIGLLLIFVCVVIITFTACSNDNNSAITIEKNNNVVSDKNDKQIAQENNKLTSEENNLDTTKTTEPTDVGSYDPKKACKAAGGEVLNFEECNGEISEFCRLPNMKSCYLDQFINGKCEGMFVPKVLCDNEEDQ